MDYVTSEIDLAYLAGIVDGEGYVGIKRDSPRSAELQGRFNRAYHARIQVRMVERAAVDLLVATVGGWMFTEKAHSDGGRPLHCWQVSDAAAERAIRAIAPYLRIKREQAETVLRLRDLQATRAKHQTKDVGERKFPNAHGTIRIVKTKALSDEYIAMCESLWARCKELNRVGPR